ncbi:MAG: hypothetical protein ABSC06_36900 [Rhodopila sp.]|jgi:hypothetical protein
MATGKTDQSYRVLWAQVVLQAKADLEHEPVDSILFNQAAAFFVSGGEWGVSRATVADCLDMHPDDLYRCGERWIADRRERDGLPPLPKRTSPAQKHGPLPRLVALPGPNSQAKKGRQTGSSQGANPFAPSRAQMDRVSA